MFLLASLAMQASGLLAVADVERPRRALSEDALARSAKKLQREDSAFLEAQKLEFDVAAMGSTEEEAMLDAEEAVEEEAEIVRGPERGRPSRVKREEAVEIEAEGASRSTEDKAQQLLDDSPKAAKEVDVSRLVAREEHPEALPPISLVQTLSNVSIALLANETDTVRAHATNAAGAVAAGAVAGAAAAKARNPFALPIAFEAMQAFFAACRCVMVFAFIVWLYRSVVRTCCGEDSCLYACASRMRLALGVDRIGEVTLRLRVHTVSGVPKSSYFLSVRPCLRGKLDRRSLLDKDNPNLRLTGTSGDLRWEEDLEIRVPQGYPKIAVGLFHPSSIPGRREKCVGWMSLKVDELLDCLPVAEHGYSLLSEDKTLAGKVSLSIRLPPKASEHPAVGRSLTAGSAALSGSPSVRLSAASPASGRLLEGSPDPDTDDESSLEAQVAECAALLRGPLEITDKYGEYHLKWFQVRHKASRDAWTWEWYSERDPLDGTKPDGKIPFRSILGICAVDQSISEFAIKYKNQQDREVTMIFQRHDRPRDAWVHDLHRMIQTLRELRRERRRKFSGGLPEADVSYMLPVEPPESGMSCSEREQDPEASYPAPITPPPPDLDEGLSAAAGRGRSRSAGKSFWGFLPWSRSEEKEKDIEAFQRRRNQARTV